MAKPSHRGKAGPAKVGVPGYVKKAQEKRREQHATAVAYVDKRDREIEQRALMLSKRAGIPYDRAREQLQQTYAEHERETGAVQKVRALALGYDESAILHKANERLNPKRDPFAGIFGGKA